MSGHKKQKGAWLNKSGASFRVWAPFADYVSVSVSGKCSFNEWQEIPLEREDDGCWFGHVNGVQAGQEYKYVIKNGKLTLHKNDPRAMHLTTTPGNSVITSPAFDWEDDHFVPPPVEKQVLYELHIGTFHRPDPASPGTFRDAVERLDHLAELGVNMVEVMPINAMIMDRGWGYGIDYIFAVESLYGGRFGFKQFVKEAHKRGIGVVLDVVFNHWGPDSALDLWQFDGWNKDGKGGIYFFNDERGDTPWGARPDYGRPEVREYIVDSIKSWLQDCHVDGFRVDSTMYMRTMDGERNNPEREIPEAWLLMQQINNVSKKINPNSIVIAEDVSYNDYITKPESEGGAGFDSQWELEFPKALRAAMASKNPDETSLTMLCNMLVKRYNNDAFQSVIFVDSHDSAANGAARFTNEVSKGSPGSLFARQRALIAAALMLTAPGIPMFFQGQEFLEPGAFNDVDGLHWGLTEKYAGILLANKHLVALRKNEAGLTGGLTGGNINLFHADDNKVLAYHRWKNGGPGDDVIVVVNFSDQSYEKYEMGLPLNGNWHVRFNSSRKAYSEDFQEMHVPDMVATNGSGSILLPPSSVIILSQNSEG